MKFQTPLSSEDSARYAALIEQGTTITRHAELLDWLQGDVQPFLPHDILLAGWGNFQEGAIQHDVVSVLPGARSYAAGTDGLPFLLAKFHDRWLAAGRQPCSLDFSEFEYLLGQASLPGSFSGSLRGMRSVLIHGMHDERAQQDCVYVLMGAKDIPSEPAHMAIRMLMPSMDAALRQMAPLPQQRRPAAAPLRGAADDACGLSERETQIMAWVAMGKTNSEIGAILSISGFTVKNHMQRIFQKLNVFNRAQAVSKVTRVSIYG
ncbi:MULTISPECIES: XrtB/PEP-CTERM-associated transcriptional regulator EpsA [unclassified Polaromonas]|uniref:XrtB/PEP-CTERM-associated transcriptional regulator EpsA n=1 Tax=unclassified Polaromonas TaxID=2638319 RepID=UPI000F07EAC1|nr:MULTISPECIES: XrtB/PEP-CTERM-associated transcriptional regulator EpsA [unclassified Polaromonas]AYQ30201.1 helix-turn-helix transcriptional regulator [Polaromonas sp. SP1]QGJ18683.1 helix-turn-helix transcriptional regulator [Polaromonas sp. Pch-P]